MHLYTMPSNYGIYSLMQYPTTLNKNNNIGFNLYNDTTIIKFKFLYLHHLNFKLIHIDYDL